MHGQMQPAESRRRMKPHKFVPDKSFRNTCLFCWEEARQIGFAFDPIHSAEPEQHEDSKKVDWKYAVIYFLLVIAETMFCLLVFWLLSHIHLNWR